LSSVLIKQDKGGEFMKGSIFRRTVCVGATAAFAIALFHAGAAMAGTRTGAATDASYLKLESIRQNYIAAQRQNALDSNNKVDELSVRNGSPDAWLSSVETSKVNMVTNRVADKALSAVTVDGHTYYVRNKDYEAALNKNLSLRFTTDPITGKKIDKSDAIILADSKGRVFYFESEKTYRDFVAQAGDNGLGAFSVR